MSQTVVSLLAPAGADAQGHAPSTRARVITALIVGLPFLALAFGVAGLCLWGYRPHLRDIVLASVMYLVIGHGLAIGFHRMLSHRAFVPNRALKLVLVALGSMAFEGGPISWVATHRRHHVFADKAGDPHSPVVTARGVRARAKGLWHAHLGWLFTDRGERSRDRTPDLVADPDLVMMNNLFPLWCAVSLALPFAIGWLLGGSFTSALTALLWAGLVRVFLLQHITWGVNSIAHTWGRRPFATGDRSTNVAALSLLSFGDSWHNGHHAFPRSARHGLLPYQFDTSAMLIDGFARFGWAKSVHRPDPAAVSAHLVPRLMRRDTTPVSEPAAR